MDIKAIIDDITGKITENKDLMTKFKSDPEEVIESLLHIDIPDDALEGLIAGVKAKIGGDKLSGLLDKAKDLLG